MRLNYHTLTFFFFFSWEKPLSFIFKTVFLKFIIILYHFCAFININCSNTHRLSPGNTSAQYTSFVFHYLMNWFVLFSKPSGFFFYCSIRFSKMMYYISTLYWTRFSGNWIGRYSIQTRFLSLLYLCFSSTHLWTEWTVSSIASSFDLVCLECCFLKNYRCFHSWCPIHSIN